MKLKHQVGFLLAVPLIFQAAFAAVMISTILKLSDAARSETRAKQILACCQSMREVEVRAAMFLTAQRFVDQVEAAEFKKAAQIKLSSASQELKKLLEGDRDSLNDLADCERNRLKFDAMLPKYTVPYTKLSGPQLTAQFLHETDCMEDMMLRFQRMRHDENSIGDRYTKAVAELQPASVKARYQMLALCVAALSINILVVAALGLFFSKHTVSRLKLLMSNIYAFSSGQVLLASVGGDDELAELNEQFSHIARAKLQLEEQRRAMYGMVSHDLRSPLTSLTLTLGTLLESGLQMDERVSKSLSRMLSESKRLVRLSSSFLDGQKFESGKLELAQADVLTENIIQQTIQAVSASAQLKSISVETNISLECASIYCDEDRVVQVLVNLLSNAIKFSPRSSVINIEVKSTDGIVLFELIDRGAKLSDQLRQNLFQPFTQLDEGASHELGTGLGLYLCKILVEAHGGELGYRDIDETTKCFWFNIPRRNLQEASPAVTTAVVGLAAPTSEGAEELSKP